MKVDVSELKKAVKSLEENKKLQDEAVKKATNIAAIRLSNLAKKNTPVRTGDLKKGWTIERAVKLGNSHVAKVKNSEPYAQYVEYGHRQVKKHKDGKKITTGWTDGRFMMTKAEQKVDMVKDKILEQEVEKVLKGAFK